MTIRIKQRIVKDFAENKGSYNINLFGWESSQKSNGRWKIILHYGDCQNRFREAEWEYNPETKKLYPFEAQNAPQFWTAEQRKDDRGMSTPPPGKTVLTSFGLCLCRAF